MSGSKTSAPKAGGAKTSAPKAGGAKPAPKTSVPVSTPFDAIEAEFVGAVGVGSDPTSLPIASVEVAFAGRSNVGKSSLINTLVQRKGLVRTSGTPGCTRQINFFSIRARDDFALVCVDLPGYGFAKRSKGEREQWADLIEGYLKRRPTLRALVLLVDARRGLEEDDSRAHRFRGSRARQEGEPGAHDRRRDEDRQAPEEQGDLFARGAQAGRAGPGSSGSPARPGPATPSSGAPSARPSARANRPRRRSLGSFPRGNSA
jgi:ribosome biogenesis GTP-binding protein YsxC/EngB